MFVCARVFIFPRLVRERSTQMRKRRDDGANGDGGRIPSWSSRGVETRVTGGARGQREGEDGWIAGRDKFIGDDSQSLCVPAPPQLHEREMEERGREQPTLQSQSLLLFHLFGWQENASRKRKSPFCGARVPTNNFFGTPFKAAVYTKPHDTPMAHGKSESAHSICTNPKHVFF